MNEECKTCPLKGDCRIKDDFVDLAVPMVPCPFRMAKVLPRGGKKDATG